jgi:hypothetical protein
MQEEFEYDDDDQWSPEVLAEIKRRIATPRDQWITMTTDEMRALIEQEDRSMRTD